MLFSEMDNDPRKYDYLELLGKTEADRTFWKRVRRTLINADEIRENAILMCQQLDRIQQNSRLWRTETVMREPLTATAVALRDTVDAINQQFAAAARAAADKRNQPIAKKSTSQPTVEEVNKFEELASGRRSRREANQDQPQLRIPNMLNEYYGNRVQAGASWDQLQGESINFESAEKTSLEKATQRMLENAANQAKPGAKEHQSRAERSETEASGEGLLKRSASRTRRDGSVAQRLRATAAVGRQVEVVPVAGLTTYQLRQRSQQRQQEAIITEKLNAMADANMSARLRARSSSTVQAENGETPAKVQKQEEPVDRGMPRFNLEPQTSSDAASAVDVSKKWKIPRVKKSEPESETDTSVDQREPIPRGIPHCWVQFRYDEKDPQKKMVRMNLRLTMELEDHPRLIMIDPWSRSSVSGISQLAKQVEVESPTVFNCKKPVRITSTRKTGQAHILVYSQQVRVSFYTQRRQELVVYIGYVKHLTGMVVFGSDFLCNFDPLFVLDPHGGQGFMILGDERIPVEVVRSCLRRPDEEREKLEQERRRWARDE